MCQRITCPVCGKPSFAGCGRHIESVLGDVPPAQRCPGHAPMADAPRGAAGPVAELRKLFDFVIGGRKRSGQ